MAETRVPAAALALALAAGGGRASGAPRCSGGTDAERAASGLRASRERLSRTDWDMRARRLGLYYECLAWLPGAGEPCRGSPSFHDSEDDPCRASYDFHAFARWILDGDPRNDEQAILRCAAYVRSIEHWRRPASLSPEAICREVAPAYRGAYDPVCSRLQARLAARADPGAAGFHYVCRSLLYPSPRDCLAVRSPERRAACETGARVREALRLKDPAACGEDRSCLAVARPRPENCEAMAREAADAACPAGGAGP